MTPSSGLPLKVGAKGDGTQPIRDLDTVRGFLSGSGPIAFFDLPWMPVYLAICFLFHTYIGLTALFGAIVLVILTVVTEVKTRRPTRSAIAIRRRAQRAAGSKPAQCRSDHGDGHGRAHFQALERSQPELRGGKRTSQRRRRRPRRDVEGFADAAAIGHPGGRRVARDQSAIDAGHHHRRLDPGRTRTGADRSRDCQLARFRRPRGKAGSGCRDCSGICRRRTSRCR